MNIAKYNSSGNSFIILDTPFSNLYNQTADYLSTLALYLCDKSKGLGSDGLIIGTIKNNTPYIRIFNSDGSEAEISGNALTIYTLYLSDNNYIKDNSIQIYTKHSRLSNLSILSKPDGLITLELKGFSFLGKDIPMSEFLDDEVILKDMTIGTKVLKFSCVNIGNPHCVVFLDQVNKDKVIELGPLIETHRLFPNRVNVEIVEVIDKRNVRIEVWERGVGYTECCGSGNAACCYVGFRLGLIEDELNVHIPQGIVRVRVSDDKVILQNKVNRILVDGKIPLDGLPSKLNFI